MENAHCKALYQYFYSSFICAVSSNEKYPSHGDSGSPIILKNSDSKNPVQIGILSSNIDIKDSKKRFIYTRITNYISWIEQVTKTKLIKAKY